jgi:hypothetical protein
MMRAVAIWGLALALSATPALAGYKLMPAGKPVAVAKSGLTVTPARDWNRLGARIGKNAETWTLDGAQLNDITFYGGIDNDKTLFREVDKRNRPLPRFSSAMLLPEIPQLLEGSYRVAVGTSLMTIDSVEPATFAGAQGVRFAYSFAVQGEEVRRKGEAHAAIIGGRLYMTTFEAPTIHYFDAGIGAYRSIAASAVLRAVAR